MSESIEHHNYVKLIYEYVSKMVSSENVGCIKADLFECEKPTLTYGDFIPDVMYQQKGVMIIGEAKTLNDFQTPHSYAQYESYMRECKEFPGESIIIICIPWQLFLSA